MNKQLSTPVHRHSRNVYEGYHRDFTNLLYSPFGSRSNEDTLPKNDHTILLTPTQPL